MYIDDDDDDKEKTTSPTRLRPKRYTNLDNANASDRRLALSATLNTWQKQIITIILSKKRKHLPEPSAIQGGADLRFYGSQPGTRQSCETTDTEPVCHMVCLFTPQLMHVSNYTAWWPKTSSSSSTLHKLQHFSLQRSSLERSFGYNAHRTLDPFKEWRCYSSII